MILNQPDFRKHPFRAFWRRLLWRFHWWYSREPVIVRNWYQGLNILLPRSGCAAQVFYRKHSSLEIVRILEKVLKQGDVVIDVGAHIGEYTLVAASLVGETGRVYAIEPQPQAAEIIRLNTRLNRLSNITVHECALADRQGVMAFRSDPRSWGGLLTHNAIEANLYVEVTTLDKFVEQQGISCVHLVKLDAAGNELAVLKGGQRMLSSWPAPIIVCKFYHHRVVWERFGYKVGEIVNLLLSYGYTLRALMEENQMLVSPANCYELFSENTYCIPILAWRKHE